MEVSEQSEPNLYLCFNIWENKLIQTKAKINFNKKLTSQYYQMSLTCPVIAKKSLPGQFIHLYIDSADVFLRRPFSIYNVTNNTIEILYKIVGPGTEYLSAKTKNQILNIVGPLGNGYRIIENREQSTENRRKKAKDKNEKKSIILVAGGTGAASLFFLAKKLQKNNSNNIKIIVLFGAKNKEELISVNEFKNIIGCQIKIATDDGSRGYKGFVSELLHNLLETGNRKPATMIYSCGPKPMLKEIAKISGIHKIPCQISLEEHMACGVGACMGCVVKIKNQKSKADFEYKRVCKEGPVFDAQKVIWE